MKLTGHKNSVPTVQCIKNRIREQRVAHVRGGRLIMPDTLGRNAFFGQVKYNQSAVPRYQQGRLGKGLGQFQLLPAPGFVASFQNHDRIRLPEQRGRFWIRPRPTPHPGRQTNSRAAEQQSQPPP